VSAEPAYSFLSPTGLSCIGSGEPIRHSGMWKMRFNGRSTVVFAAIFALQIAICPAVCSAGSPDPSVASQANAAGEAEHSLPPCHKGQTEAPQDAPHEGDPAPACTSCSAETPLSHISKAVPHSPSLSLAVFLPEVVAAPGGAFSTPFEPNRAPPPAPLFLLKNSFLL
jgi:hypothetical protein